MPDGLIDDRPGAAPGSITGIENLEDAVEALAMTIEPVICVDDFAVPAPSLEGGDAD